MSDAPPDPVPTSSPPSSAALQELRDLSRKVDLVAGAVATIAAGHHELLDHVAESVARQSHDALEIADRLSAIERQVLAATGGEAAVAAAADAALIDRLEAIERAVAALPGAAPGVESTFVALADRLDALLDGEREGRETIAGLTAAVDALRTRVADDEAEAPDPASAGPDVQAELEALTDAQRAVADELAALGPRVNELLDRHPGGLPLPPRLLADEGSPRPSTEVDLSPLQGQVADLAEVTASQANDLTLALEVLSKVADGIDRLDVRTEDRLAAVDGTDPVILEKLDDVAQAVQSLTGQLPELVDAVAALAVPAAGITPTLVMTTPAASSDALLEARLTHHIDVALAGVLRLFDDRLVALRASLSAAAPMSTVAAPSPSPAGSMGGFEAGAVMGAAQAAWNRLEQRLDEEFDDLSRQLQALAALVEQAVASTEELANRPVVSGDQVKRAAVTLRDTVVNASRQRRERRGGPKGLGSGPGSSGY